MNAREWAGLAAPAADWAGLAAALETPDGGLEAVFDDAGRAGLGWRPSGDARRWAAWTRLLASEGVVLSGGPMPERCWAMREGGRLHEVWGEWDGVRPRVSRWAPGETPLAGPLTRLAPGRSKLPGGLERLFSEFHGLHPLSELRLGLDRLTARLAAPAAWPLFTVCDIAKPFAARSQSWARRLGARGVAAFALGGGRMDVSVA